MSMRCDKIGELLSPYLDNMTSEKETRCVESHLESCSICRHELEQMKLLCHAMRNLDEPEVPESFEKDLCERLSNEHLKYFGFKRIKTPKRSGWIAAVVAGMALMVGIYASSFLPVGNMVAKLQGHMDKNKTASSVAINNILNNVKHKTNQQKTDRQVAKSADKTNNSTQVAATDNAKANLQTTQDTTSTYSASSIKSKNAATVTAPQKAVSSEVITTSVQVADIGNSIQQVMGITGENGGQYTNLAATSGTVQPFSGTRTRTVSLKIPRQNVGKVLEQLQSIGVAATPVYNQVDITSQYNEVENNIDSLQTQVNQLSSSNNQSDADKAKIKQLNQQLIQLEQKRDLLDRTQINVNLIEEITP